MADIYVDNLQPVSGSAIPSRGSDASGTYLAWALNDAAAFTIEAPASYLPGTDLVLKWTEATAGESLNHQWQVTITLQGDSADILTSELTSSATASELTDRTLTLTTDGEIDGTAVAVGDVLKIAISRISASASEDPNDIKLYILAVGFTAADEGESTCLGRIGKIIDRVTWNINEVISKTDFCSAADVVDLCNQCTGWMIEHGYRWKTTFDLDLVADQQEYDLNTLATEMFLGLEWCQWLATKQQLKRLSTRQDLEDVLSVLPSGNRTYVYVEENGLLQLGPVPESNATAAIRIYYTYEPDDLACLTSYTPAIPSAHDAVYVNFCIWRLYLRERGALASNDSMAKYWQGETQTAFNRLLGTQRGQLKLRPCRT